MSSFDSHRSEVLISKPKTICFVSLEVAPTTPGGAGTLLGHTMKMLLQGGHNVILVLGSSKADFEKFRDVDSTMLPNRDHLKVFWRGDFNAENVPMPANAFDDVYRYSIMYSRVLTAIVAKYKVDVVEFYDYCGPAWHWLATPQAAQVTTYVRLHSTIEVIFSKIREPFSVDRVRHFAQERNSLCASAALLVPGMKFFNDLVAPIYPYLDRDKAIYSKPNLSPLKSAQFSSDGRKVIFYGRRSAIKGLDTFLEGLALACLDDKFNTWLEEVVIIGPEEPVSSKIDIDAMLKNAPASLRGKVRSLLHVNHEELVSALKDAAFAVFCNRIESFCYAAHEVQSAGIPLIVSSIPAFQDHFAPKQQAVFFNGSAHDLSLAMQSLAQDTKARVALSKVGDQRRLEYRENHYESHFEELTTLPPSGSPIEISVIVFAATNGPQAARTVASCKKLGLQTILLVEGEGGVRFGGKDFHIDDKDATFADKKLLGDAFIGIRAGDILSSEWILSAKLTLQLNPRIGTLGCWSDEFGTLTCGLQNQIAEHGLFYAQGMRCITRLSKRLTPREFLNAGRTSGELHFMLEARSRGLGSLESAMVGIVASEIVEHVDFDSSAILLSEFDRVDNAYVILQRQLTINQATKSAVNGAVFKATVPEYAISSLEPTKFVLKARPDIQPGEFWLLDLRVRAGAPSLASTHLNFRGYWIKKHLDNVTDTAIEVAPWDGSVTFEASRNGFFETFTGPHCGVVEIVADGVSTIFNLKQGTELQRSRIYFAGPTFVSVATSRRQIDNKPNGVDEIFARIDTNRQIGGATTRSLLVYSAGFSSEIATELKAMSSHVLQLQRSEVQSGNLQSLATVISSAIKADKLEKVTIDFISNQTIELLHELAALEVQADVECVLPGPHYWALQKGDFSLYGHLVKLKSVGKNHQTRLEYIASDQAIADVAIAFGLPTKVWSSSRPQRAFGKSLDTKALVCVGDASSSVPSNGHLVCAAIRCSDLTSEVVPVLPEFDLQAAKIATVFGLAEYQTYSDFEQLGAQFADRRVVVLSAYPDTRPNDFIDLVISKGMVPIVGPGYKGHLGAAEKWLRVSFWDDSATLSDAALAALENWDEITSELIEGRVIKQ